MGREDKASTFSVVPNDRVRGNMHKMKYKKFHLNPRKKIFCCKDNHTLEEVAPSSCGVSILKDFHSSDQPVLVIML